MGVGNAPSRLRGFAASRELMGEDSNMASHALARSPVPGCCRSRFRSLCEAALVDFRCRN